MSEKKVKFKEWDCILRQGKYQNGNIALYLEDAETFERIAVCSVNLDKFPLADNEVFIKDYSENEGMLEALLDAGAVKEKAGAVSVDYGTHKITFPCVEVVQ